MFIRKFLDISTGHLTPATRSRFDNAPPWLAYPHPEGFGWFIYVSTDPGGDEDYYPQDLIACFKLARTEGCDYILFDSDADAMADLPYYNDKGELEVAEGIPDFDNAQADSEGWAIFGRALCEGHFQLQKCDDSDAFPDDGQAWEFVVEKARGGSAYHQSALEYLKKYTPSEYHLIVRRFPYPSNNNERSEEPTHATQNHAGQAGRPGDAEDRHRHGQSGEEALQGSRVPIDGSPAQQSA